MNNQTLVFNNRNALESTLGTLIQSDYQIFYMLEYDFVSIKQEEVEDIEIILNNENMDKIYIQLKYNKKSTEDSFSPSSMFFKTFNDQERKKDAKKILYICDKPNKLNNFWKKNPELIYKYYKLIKNKKLMTEMITIKTEDNEIDKLYEKYFSNIHITQEQINYVRKYTFEKVMANEDINNCIDKKLKEYAQKNNINTKQEENFSSNFL